MKTKRKEGCVVTHEKLHSTSFVEGTGKKMRPAMKMEREWLQCETKGNAKSGDSKPQHQKGALRRGGPGDIPESSLN